MSSFSFTPDEVQAAGERHEAAQANLDRFYGTLAAHYRHLFANCPDYAYAASQTTPEALARKMTLGLDAGTANKDGDGVRRTCRDLGIAYTYKAIRAYLGGE